MQMNSEQRTGPDRRRRPTPWLSRYTFTGRRRAVPRRAGDSTAIYVDRLGGGLSLILASILLFQCLDGGFTLLHLSQGGRELNPLMDYLIQRGSWAFLGIKLGTAVIGLFLLGIHKNFRWVKEGIGVLFLLYAGVIGYHVLLLP
jgi:hypothetical protein